MSYSCCTAKCIATIVCVERPIESRFGQFDATQLRTTVERFGNQLDQLERRISYLRAKRVVSEDDILAIEQRVAEFRAAVAAAREQQKTVDSVEYLQSLQGEIDELLGRAESK